MVRRGGSAMGSVVEADRPGIGGHKGKSILEAVPDGLRSVGHRGNDQMGRKDRIRIQGHPVVSPFPAAERRIHLFFRPVLRTEEAGAPGNIFRIQTGLSRHDTAGIVLNHDSKPSYLKIPGTDRLQATVVFSGFLPDRKLVVYELFKTWIHRRIV